MLLLLALHHLPQRHSESVRGDCHPPYVTLHLPANYQDTAIAYEFCFLVGNNGTSWHTAEVEISSAYKAFSNEKIMGRLGVYIGLSHVNVTLEAMPIYYNGTMDVNFNER